MAGEEDQDFNLVILDLATPGLHGRAVLHQVRGSVETAALPVLIRIATGSDQIEAELLENEIHKAEVMALYKKLAARLKKLEAATKKEKGGRRRKK